MYFLKTIDTDLGREIHTLKAKWVGLIQTTVTGGGGVGWGCSFLLTGSAALFSTTNALIADLYLTPSLPVCSLSAL